MEAARMLKANLRLEGKPCGWCQAPLALGDDAAACTGCEGVHHRGCWDTRAGCATPSCISAPLPRLGDAIAAAPASPYATTCPRCGLGVMAGVALCPGCRAICTPDGLYHGPRTNAPGAVKSLVCGLIGLVVCGIVLGPIAISSANSAREAMARDPSLGGEGLATAGKVLGVIDLVLFALFVIARVAATR